MTSTLGWIVASGFAMSAIALVGTPTLLLGARRLEGIVTLLVALAAGSLLGGAFFHMPPAALHAMPAAATVFLWTLLGFTVFLALEQFLHWHHFHRGDADCKKPLGTLILVGDGLHNFLGGLGVAGAFLIDIRLGVTAWIAAAAATPPSWFPSSGELHLHRRVRPHSAGEPPRHRCRQRGTHRGLRGRCRVAMGPSHPGSLRRAFPPSRFTFHLSRFTAGRTTVATHVSGRFALHDSRKPHTTTWTSGRHCSTF